MEERYGLGRVNPTVRLILFVILSTVVTLSNEWVPVLIALGVGLLLLMAGRKYPRAALVACFSAFFLTFLGHAVTAEDPSFSLLIFDLSRTSVLKGLRLGLRLAAMILPAIAFIAVTPLHELLEAFRGLRVPAVVDMYLTIVLRYVDILWYDIQTSMKAMAVRGVNWEGGIGDKIPAFRRLMLPLIFRILDHVDGQSLAIDNRGGVRVAKSAPDVPANVDALVVEEVYVFYGSGEKAESHAVEELNLTVPQGGATVLLGQLGAGKTTTLLLSTGLIPKSVGRMKGNVSLFGHNTKQASLEELGQLARIVFPSAVQGLVGLTVRDELSFSLRASALSAEAAERAMLDALATVGLDAYLLPRLTLGLSGGEMQRVALASAIVANPYLLALDDVTVQLDPVGKREVLAALQTLLGGQVTTVMSDPHVELLAEVATRFVSLEKGRVTGVNRSMDADHLEGAGLRVPQMWRLGRALEMDLPVAVAEASAEVAARAPAEPPVFPQPAEAKEQPAVVRAEKLTFTYPDGPTALHGIDLSLKKGEFTAILGSNGSGKSTTALLLAGALKPSSGTVYLGEEPFDQARHRGQVGYVFQEPVNQVVTMTVYDELAFGPRQLGWDDAATAEAVEREMARFALEPDAVPLHLAPAEARKLAIAATLTMNPRLVILDEPTNNLDEAELHHLMRHLRQLQEEGTTVAVITHDVEVACRYAARVVVMSQGEIMLDGPTRQVMQNVEKLRASDVLVPPVVELSLVLWPTALPALTVDEMAVALQRPATTADEAPADLFYSEEKSG